MFVIAAPGQGSQKPGFLVPWLENPLWADQMQAWSHHINIDLVAHGTTSDLETITDTAIAQPLIVAAGIMSGRALLATLPKDTPLAFAGHSVGEFTAAALSGVLPDEDALSLVALRGAAMAAASARESTGMAAIIGGDTAAVEAALTAADLYPANHNGGGQIVAAGTTANLEAFAAHPPEGLRVIPLSVAGAFHTPFMESAVAELADAAASRPLHDPTHVLYTNRDGSRVDSGAQAMSYMIDQVARPVRWDRCMESFHREGITGMMELAPAGALAGLAKRALQGVPVVAIKTPDDIEKAQELVNPS